MDDSTRIKLKDTLNDELIRAFELGYSKGWEAGFKEGVHYSQSTQIKNEGKSNDR